MKFKDKFNINPEYESLLEFKSEKDKLKHEARMIMFRFLSEIEKLNDNAVQKKDIAKALHTSASFVTQLFNGDKLANLTTIAKLQQAFNVTFHIKAVPILANDFKSNNFSQINLIVNKKQRIINKQSSIEGNNIVAAYKKSNLEAA